MSAQPSTAGRAKWDSPRDARHFLPVVVGQVFYQIKQVRIEVRHEAVLHPRVMRRQDRSGCRLVFVRVSRYVGELFVGKLVAITA